jgi:hypothetical protein
VSAIVGPFASSGPQPARYTLGLDVDPALDRPDDLDCQLWGGSRLEISVGRVKKEPVAAAIGCLIVRALEDNHGLLLHGAGLLRGGAGHVFVGERGAGKSTIARNAAGLQCLHEEKVAVRRRDGRWWAYGVPVLDNSGATGTNVVAPLAGIYLIEKGPLLQRVTVERKRAVHALPPHVVLPIHDPVARGKLAETLLLLVDEVPVERLVFRKYSNVAEVIGSS